MSSFLTNGSDVEWSTNSPLYGPRNCRANGYVFVTHMQRDVGVPQTGVLDLATVGALISSVNGVPTSYTTQRDALTAAMIRDLPMLRALRSGAAIPADAAERIAAASVWRRWKTLPAQGDLDPDTIYMVDGTVYPLWMTPLAPSTAASSCGAVGGGASDTALPPAAPAQPEQPVRATQPSDSTAADANNAMTGVYLYGPPGGADAVVGADTSSAPTFGGLFSPSDLAPTFGGASGGVPTWAIVAGVGAVAVAALYFATRSRSR